MSNLSSSGGINDEKTHTGHHYNIEREKMNVLILAAGYGTRLARGIDEDTRIWFLLYFSLNI